MSEMPVDVLSKTAFYHLGEPKYSRLKHSKGLRQIQKRYRQIYSGLKSMQSYDIDDDMFYEMYQYKLTTKDTHIPFKKNLLKELDYKKQL